MVISVELMAIAVGFIWLIILTIIFFRLLSHYNNLVKGASNKTLKSILDELLTDVGQRKKETTNLHIRLEKLEKESLFHIQKIGLVRFNPFKDTGGDQSFILVLSDAKDNGIVISGLYSRSGTRWYAKRIIEGKGIEYDLSDEEKKAIKEAKMM